MPRRQEPSLANISQSREIQIKNNSQLTKCIANCNPKEITIAGAFFVCSIVSALEKAYKLLIKT